MRAAIMGVGSIGLVLGTLINKNGGQIDLIDPYEEHVKALREKGATITGTLDVQGVKVNAYTPAEVEGIYDVIILLTKQTGTREALEALLPHLAEDGVVCTLQNGIPEPLVASIVGEARTMGGIVMFAASFVGPGVTRCTSGKGFMEGSALVELGEVSGEMTPRLKAVQQLLEYAGKCEALDNLMSLRWTKLLINAAASGMSASLGQPMGGFLDDGLAMFALAKIADEAARVTHAKGYGLVEINGSDFKQALLTPGQSAFDKRDFFFPIWDKAHRSMKASMLNDLEAQRPTEIDYINGAVYQAGREVGMFTPYNAAVVALVKAAETKKTVPEMGDSMRFFELLYELTEGKPYRQ